MAARVSSSRFVDRQEELAVLESLLEHSRGGAGSLALVCGEPGIGKSRLIQETTLRAEQAGMTVVAGECVPIGEGELPYAPVIAALRSLLRKQAVADRGTQLRSRWPQLAALVPELSRTAEAALQLHRDGSQGRLFEQLLDLFASAARVKPLVFVVEDFQWADRSTCDFLSFLVRGGRHEPMALIISFRSDELDRRHPLRPSVVELERRSGAIRLELAPFTRSQLREQVSGILDQPPPVALVDRLIERTEGNPFFTEELLAASRARGDALPRSLRDALMARVDAQSTNVQNVLRVAAVAGRGVDHALLTAAANLAEDDLDAALAEAISAHLLIHGGPSADYSFRHALLREAVYVDMLPEERRKLHLRLAQTLESCAAESPMPAPRAAELARHWYAAGEMSAALPAALNAASTAEEIYALGEALLHYERALEVWEEADRPVAELPFDRTEVMRRAAQAANLTGDTERAIAYARAALTRVEKDGQTAEAALAHERLGRYLWTAGRGDDALPEYSLAVELMPDDPPSEERALVVAAEAQALMLCNLHAESSPLCEEALTMARSVGSQRIEANVLNTISANCAASGYFEQAVATAGDALALARDLNLGEEVCRSYTNGGDALHQAGELQRSIAAAHEGIRMAAHFGIDRQWGDFLRAELAGRLLHVGRWQEAEELLNAIVEHAPRGVNAGNTYAHFGHLLARQGSFEKACEMLARADENIAGSGTAMWLAPPAAARAVLELWAGHPENAIALVTDCLDRISGREHPFFSARLYGIGLRAFADLAARAPGDQQIRRRQAGRAEALIDRLDSLTAPLAGTWPLISASRAECAAELARVAGRSNADLWAYAAEAWQAADDPYVAAYARWREAEALLEVDARRKRAVPLVRDAASVATRLGARPLVEELEGLARRAGIDLRQHTGTETPNPALAKLELTPRELEVLALLGDGMTNREIASELFISHKTASVHVSRILSKLSVTNRAAAAAAAQRLGVVGAGMSGRPSNPRVPRDPDL